MAVLLLGLATPTAADPDVRRRLTAIREAFLRNQSAALAGQFLPAQPVFVCIPRLVPASFFGPSQLRSLLDHVARGTRTVSFEFTSRPADRESDELTVYADARWTYRELASGATRVERLSLALRQSPGDREWRIAEIHSLR